MSKSGGVVTINGKSFSTKKLSGQKPIIPSVDGFSARTARSQASKLHQEKQRTLALKREIVKKPAKTQAATSVQTKAVIRHTTSGQTNKSHRAIATPKSPLISRLPSTLTQLEHKVVSNLDDNVRSLSDHKDSLLREALGSSHAHHKHHKRPHLRGQIATGLSALAVTVLVVYLNLPVINIKIASSRAGITARVPSYTAGFNRSNSVATEPGRLTLSFGTKVDDRSFSISQKKSLWDSQSLLSNYVLRTSNNYEVYRDRGITLYVYNGSSATWVDGGIWYDITGDANLTPAQLLKIAASM